MSARAPNLLLGSHTERPEAILRGPIAAIQVVMHDTKVVIGGVRKVRAARTIAHRPNIGRGRLQPLVHLDIAMPIELDSGLLESDPIGVRRPARRGEESGTFDNSLVLSVLGIDPQALRRNPPAPTEFARQYHP